MNIVNILYSMPHFGLQFLTRQIPKHKEAIRRLILERAPDKDARILDFGCGEGIFSAILKDNDGFQYVGVDKNHNCLQLAKILNPKTTFIQSNEDLCNFKEDSFDCIILNNVLHHMKNTEIKKLISQLKRVMKKSASIIVVELVQRNEQKGFFFKCVTFLEERVHRISYCEDSFFSLLGQEFRQIHCEPFGCNFKGWVFIL